MGGSCFDLQSWVNSQHYDWQVTVVAADDIEGGYDCPGATRQFPNGFNGNNQYRAPMYDYGDATISPSCTNGGANWTTADFYYVSWALPIAFPFPEAYSSGQVQHWYDMEAAQGHVYFTGALATCQGTSGDPGWQPNPCPNGYPTPVQSWQLLYRSGANQTFLNYLSNIQFH